MRIRTLLIASLSLVHALSIQASEVYAQQGSSLEITVRSAEGDQPLSGALVILEGAAARGITGPGGFLRIENLLAGPNRLRVRHLGYASVDEPISFSPGQPRRVLVRLAVEPIALAPIRVTGRRSILATRGFFERQNAGFGTFLTRAQIVSMNPQHMSDVLRRTSGIQVGTSTFGSRPPASIRGNGPQCPIQYFVDGALTSNFNIDEVLPQDVEGLEIYRGGSTVPPAFNRGTARCGVILVWTRIE